MARKTRWCIGARRKGLAARPLDLVGYGDEDEGDDAGQRGRGRMNRFAELLDRLAYEPGRNNKLRLLTAYFREVEDPDRGYALAALTGALSFKHAKPGLIRDLIAERTDPVLFALSYDYVGDLSETVALMWPGRSRELSPSPLAGEGGGGSAPARAAIEAPSPTSASPRTASVRPQQPASPPSPKSSPRCARSARPNCRDSSRAGSTSSTRPAAGRC